ncbi:hypothetical protein [Acaryochloris marina]|uniref:hypothetical protein n=1 Tax=Acaryochloris marina TaxID=155978 RepID=UPI001BAF00EF|nr:hypothetical protein [Acaryochloris marina]QUY44440.1 hypothetical protein I1H34_10320 [Acaryochloris marina S15]
MIDFLQSNWIDPVQTTVHDRYGKWFLGAEISLMSDSNKSPFNQQLTKWWDLVSAKDTWDSFKKFFELAWTIIKETGILAYLFILGGLVSIGWVKDRYTDLSESVKSLQNQANEVGDGNLVSEAGKSLIEATKKGADNALQTARTKLDIKVPEKKTKEPVAAKPTASKPPASAPAASPAPASTPAPSPSPSAESKAEEEVTRQPDSQEPPESQES